MGRVVRELTGAGGDSTGWGGGVKVGGDGDLDVDVEDRVSLGEEEASSDWLGEEGFSVFSSILVSIATAPSAVISTSV